MDASEFKLINPRQYEVALGNDKSLAELLALAGYGYDDHSHYLNEKNFPLEESPPKKIFTFTQIKSSYDDLIQIREHLKLKGLRGATLKEFLYFLIQEKKFQDLGDIFILGCSLKENDKEKFLCTGLNPLAKEGEKKAELLFSISSTFICENYDIYLLTFI